MTLVVFVWYIIISLQGYLKIILILINGEIKEKENSRRFGTHDIC